MERLKLEESYNPIRSPTPAVVPAAPQPTINTTTAQRSLPDVSTTTEKATSKTPTSRSGSGGKSRTSASASTTSASQTSTSALPKKRKRRKTAVDESQAPAASSSSAMSAEDTAKADSRKPSLACTFCRERKISCGRPPPGSTDDTCKYVWFLCSCNTYPDIILGFQVSVLVVLSNASFSQNQAPLNHVDDLELHRPFSVFCFRLFAFQRFRCFASQYSNCFGMFSLVHLSFNFSRFGRAAAHMCT